MMDFRTNKFNFTLMVQNISTTLLGLLGKELTNIQYSTLESQKTQNNAPLKKTEKSMQNCAKKNLRHCEAAKGEPCYNEGPLYKADAVSQILTVLSVLNSLPYTEF